LRKRAHHDTYLYLPPSIQKRNTRTRIMLTFPPLLSPHGAEAGATTAARSADTFFALDARRRADASLDVVQRWQRRHVGRAHSHIGDGCRKSIIYRWQQEEEDAGGSGGGAGGSGARGQRHGLEGVEEGADQLWGCAQVIEINLVEKRRKREDENLDEYRSEASRRYEPEGTRVKGNEGLSCENGANRLMEDCSQPVPPCPVSHLP